MKLPKLKAPTGAKKGLLGKKAPATTDATSTDTAPAAPKVTAPKKPAGGALAKTANPDQKKLILALLALLALLGVAWVAYSTFMGGDDTVVVAETAPPVAETPTETSAPEAIPEGDTQADATAMPETATPEVATTAAAPEVAAPEMANAPMPEAPMQMPAADQSAPTTAPASVPNTPVSETEFRELSKPVRVELAPPSST